LFYHPKEVEGRVDLGTAVKVSNWQWWELILWWCGIIHIAVKACSPRSSRPAKFNGFSFSHAYSSGCCNWML